MVFAGPLLVNQNVIHRNQSTIDYYYNSSLNSHAQAAMLENQLTSRYLVPPFYAPQIAPVYDQSVQQGYPRFDTQPPPRQLPLPFQVAAPLQYAYEECEYEDLAFNQFGHAPLDFPSTIVYEGVSTVEACKSANSTSPWATSATFYLSGWYLYERDCNVDSYRCHVDTTNTFDSYNMYCRECTQSVDSVASMTNTWCD